MPTIPFNYANLGGGLNTRDSFDLLTDEQSRDLQNVQGLPSGAIVKRPGLATFATPASAATSLFACEATASPFLIAPVGSTLISISVAGAITNITGTTVPAAGTNWEWITAPAVSGQGPLFGMNGVNVPQQWTGSGVMHDWTNTSGAVAVPSGKYCVVWRNRVFVAGIPGSPSTVYWSAISDPTSWDPASITGAGHADFDIQDGEAITGLGVVGPYLMVAKPRKLWMMVEPGAVNVSDTITRQMPGEIGCVSHRSIASSAQGTYFLSEDRGVLLTNGSTFADGSTYQPVSDIIKPTVSSILKPSQAAGVVFGQHYYLSCAINGATNDTVLDFDESLQSWWLHTFGSNEFTVWHPAGTALLYSAKSSGAFIDQAFAPGVTTDNGTPFTWRWRGPWQSPSFYRRRLFPTTYFRKRLRQIRIGGHGLVDFYVAHDFSGGETLWDADVFDWSVPTTDVWAGVGTFCGDGLFGGVPLNDQAIFFSLGVARAHSMVFSGTSDQPGDITSYTFFIADRRDRMVG